MIGRLVCILSMCVLSAFLSAPTGHGSGGFLVSCVKGSGNDLPEGLYTVEYLKYREAYHNKFISPTRHGNHYASTVLGLDKRGNLTTKDPSYYMAAIAEKLYTLHRQDLSPSPLLTGYNEFLRSYEARPSAGLKDKLNRNSSFFSSNEKKLLPVDEKVVEDELQSLRDSGAITQNCIDPSSNKVRKVHAALRTEPLEGINQRQHVIHILNEVRDSLWWQDPLQFSMLLTHEYLWNFVDLDVRKLWAVVSYLHSQEFMESDLQSYKAKLSELGLVQNGINATTSFFFSDSFGCGSQQDFSELPLDKAKVGVWSEKLDFHLAMARRFSIRSFGDAMEILSPWKFDMQRFPQGDTAHTGESFVKLQKIKGNSYYWWIKLGYNDQPLSYSCLYNFDNEVLDFDLRQDATCIPADEATKKYDRSLDGSATPLNKYSQWRMMRTGSCFKISKIDHAETKAWRSDKKTIVSTDQVIFLQPTSVS